MVGFNSFAMNKFILAIIVLIVVVSTILVIMRQVDHREDASVWAGLSAQQQGSPLRFEASMVAGLPAPAQRFFLFAIKTGTPLYTVAEISMKGELSLGTQENPGYMPMLADQILAAPYGFVWKLKAGEGLIRVSGSDGADTQAGRSWSRFWLRDFLPVGRTGGNPDHFRSALGRHVSEAVFWTPAALLPSENIRWDLVDESTARVTLTYMGLEQSVDLLVDADGKLSAVTFERWSDANAEKQFQLQPFGGYLSDYKEFDGFRLPTKIEAGNFFGTDKYFPFYKVRLTSIRFPVGSDD